MAFDPLLCAGCPLEGIHRPVDGEGPEDARFLVVTDVPTRAAAKDGRLMPNADKRIFGQSLFDQGFTRDDFRFVPMARCAYDPNNHTNKEKTAIHKHCRVHLLNEIEVAPREAIITLGAPAASAAMGRATKITSVRGAGHRVDGIPSPIFPMMSPFLVRKFPQNAPVFDADSAAFKRFLDAGGDMAAAQAARRTGNYTIVKDLQFLIDQDPEALQVIAFDTEGTGLRWYQPGVDVRSYDPRYHRRSAVFKPKFQLLTMQFSIREGESFVLVWDHPEDPIPEADKPRLRNQIRKLLCHPNRIVVGQRLKFDLVALWMTEGIRFRIGGDTNMLLALLDENALEKNLDIATKLYVPEMAGYADHFNRTVDKSRMWEVPLSEIVEYGGGDSDATLRLYNVLEARVVADEKLWAHYTRVSVPGLNALAGLEVEGMYTDVVHALPEFRATMETEVEAARVALLAALPRALKRKIVEDYRAHPNPKTGKPDPSHRNARPEEILSFTRTDFLREILFTHPLGFKLKPKVFTKSTAELNDTSQRQPSTSSKDHLPYFFETEPFTYQLAEYVKDNRLLGTSVIRFEENYIVGGKVRPTYQLGDTVTGRVNSIDPNGQNFPKRGARAKVYRKMFVAPPRGWALAASPYAYLAYGSRPVEVPDDEDEWIVIACDLSQAELRFAANYANEQTMLHIYQTGGDIHEATAQIVMDVTPEQWAALPKAERKAARQKAKAVNFGFLYGMGWRKFIGYAKTQYGVEFTEEEAQRVRAGFFRKYSRLDPWHKRIREFVRKHKYVRSFTGRIRHLPTVDSSEEYVQQEAERQGINSPVQETGSSIGVMAMGRIAEEVNPVYMRLVGFVHDQLVAYVRKRHLDWGICTMRHYMQTTPMQEWFGVNLKCPIVADAEFGESFGTSFECENHVMDGTYNYRAAMEDEDGNVPFELPEQETPPNNGRLLRSAFTTDEDLEDENVIVAPRVHRIIRGKATEATLKRIDRSNRQMIINRRNRTLKQEEAKAVRRILRTTLPVAEPAAAPRRLRFPRTR